MISGVWVEPQMTSSSTRWSATLLWSLSSGRLRCGYASLDRLVRKLTQGAGASFASLGSRTPRWPSRPPVSTLRISLRTFVSAPAHPFRLWGGTVPGAPPRTAELLVQHFSPVLQAIEAPLALGGIAEAVAR